MSEKRRVLLKGFTSSAVSSVVYFPDDSTLRVVYKSNDDYTYIYSPVSAREFMKLAEADSVGTVLSKMRGEWVSQKIKRNVKVESSKD